MIRSFRLRDLMVLRELAPLGVAFDLKRLLLDDPSPVQSALLGYLTHHRLGAFTCIADADHDDLKSCAQVWPDRGGCGWSLGFMSPSLDHSGHVADSWCRLLAHLIVAGAGRGVDRILIRSAEDAQVEDLLREVGFRVAGREEVFVLRGEPQEVTSPSGLRRVRPSDSWALDHFFREAVPPAVHQPSRFGLREQRPLHYLFLGAPGPDEFVWMVQGAVAGYFRLTRSARGCWLEVWVLPEHRGQALPHIRYMLSLRSVSAERPAYCPVPDYAAGVGWLLRTLGFESLTRQVLLSTRTVARVRVQWQSTVPRLDQTVEMGPSVGPVSRCALTDRLKRVS